MAWRVTLATEILLFAPQPRPQRPASRPPLRCPYTTTNDVGLSKLEEVPFSPGRPARPACPAPAQRPDGSRRTRLLGWPGRRLHQALARGRGRRPAPA